MLYLTIISIIYSHCCYIVINKMVTVINWEFNMVIVGRKLCIPFWDTTIKRILLFTSLDRFIEYLIILIAWKTCFTFSSLFSYGWNWVSKYIYNHNGSLKSIFGDLLKTGIVKVNNIDIIITVLAPLYYDILLTIMYTLTCFGPIKKD